MSGFHSFCLMFLVDKNQMFVKGGAAEKLEQRMMIKWTLMDKELHSSFSAVQISGALDQTLKHVLNFNLSVSVSCWMWCMNCTVLD